MFSWFAACAEQKSCKVCGKALKKIGIANGQLCLNDFKLRQVIQTKLNFSTSSVDDSLSWVLSLYEPSHVSQAQICHCSDMPLTAHADVQLYATAPWLDAVLGQHRNRRQGREGKSVKGVLP